MKINRRESIKAIISVLGAPFLLGREAVAQERFQFDEELKGRIAEDTPTDVYPPLMARPISDFETGYEKGKTEISYKGFMVIDDLDKFEEDPRKAARFEGSLTHKGETFPIDKGKVRLFTSEGDKKVRYIIYYLPFSTPKGQYVLNGYKKVKIINLNPIDFLKDMTTLYTYLHQGPFEGSLDSPKLGPLLGVGMMYFDKKDIPDLILSCRPRLKALKFFKIIATDAIEGILKKYL